MKSAEATTRGEMFLFISSRRSNLLPTILSLADVSSPWTKNDARPLPHCDECSPVHESKRRMLCQSCRY